MNLTGIEWVRNPDRTQGYTLNPLSGCLNHTPEGLCLGGLFPCYAWKLAHGRLKPLYLANHDVAVPCLAGREIDKAMNDPFYPRFWEERLTPLHIPRKADSPKKGIFVCDMGELFGDWIPRSWQEQIFNAIKANPDYRFYLLTKQPQNLIKFSPFPNNAWVGVTATNQEMAWIASKRLSQIEARVKFLSIEPLLSWKTSTPYTTENIVAGLNGDIDWLIIGALTFRGNIAGKYPHLTPMPYERIDTLQPKIEWVREIVEAADKGGVKVFLKDNLTPLLSGHPDFWEDIPQGDHPNYESILMLRQEMPA